MEKPYEYYLKCLPQQHKGSLLYQKSVIRSIDKMHRKRILYINAPPGRGKTAAVYQWLTTWQYDHTWLYLDERDADELEFCRDILLALSKSYTENETLQSVTQGSDLYHLSLAYASFAFQSIKAAQSPFVFVLDHFQYAANSKTLAVLSELVDQTPDNFFLVVLDSCTPSPETAKFFRRPIVSRFPVEKLRLNAADIQKYLAEQGLSPDKTQSEALVSVLSDNVHLLPLVTEADLDRLCEGGATRPLPQPANWINDRVIHSLSAKHRYCHMKLSVVDIVDPAFIVYLTGNEDGITCMDDLAAKTGLVTRLADGYYRYHPLLRAIFREMMQRDTALNAYKTYGKIAAWYYLKADYYQAIRYALKAKDAKLIIRIIQSLSDATAADYGFSPYGAYVLRQLTTPEAAVACPAVFEDQTVLAYFAWLSFLAGDRNSYTNWANKLAGLASDPETAAKYDSTFTKHIVMIDPAGNPEAAAAAFEEKKPAVLRGQPRVFAFDSFTFNLPLCHNGIVDYSPIAHTAPAFFKARANAFKKMWRTAAPVLKDVIQSGLLMEQGQLNQALALCLHACDRLKKGTPAERVYAVYMMLCEIYDRLSMPNECRAAAKQLEEAIYANQAYYLLPNFRAAETTRQLRYGNKKALSDWLSETNPKIEDTVNFYTYPRHFVTARCLTASGRFKEANELLKKLADFCEAYNRVLDKIKVLILHSINDWNLNNRKKALTYMVEALRLSQPYQYTEIFMHEADDIEPILRKIFNRVSRGQVPHIEKIYVKFLVARMGVQADSRSAVSMTSLSGLKPKKLSERQTAMLQYLARGLTYSEICAETGLKITSVREHITKLYAKLSVNNAADMLKKARELNLI